MSTLGEFFGLNYDEPLFRPPAESNSLILQVTIGCSWNRCTFCEMYQSKKFQIKSIDDIESELVMIRDCGGEDYIRDIFLADGDAMMLPTAHLVEICQTIKKYFPKVRRISSYCLPRNLLNKKVDELSMLKQAGLSLVYVGCESGDDTVLEAVNKGESFKSSIDALSKLSAANIKTSIMILIGLGGKALSRQHALSSATLVNISKPTFLSTLVVSFPQGEDRVRGGYSYIQHEFQSLSPRETLIELETFLNAIDDRDEKVRNTIFRSDHASNYFILKGRLREKSRLLKEIRLVLDAPDDSVYLQPEWMRGL